MNRPLERRLLGFLEPLVQSMGYELLHLEMQGRDGVLRLYIDHRPPNGGQPREVTLQDCEHVSREVDAALDVEDIIAHRYRLEISSPGLDRPLVKASHFRRFHGRRARVTLTSPIQGRRRFRGTIAGVEEDAITLEVEDTQVRLPFDDIQKARLIPEFES